MPPEQSVHLLGPAQVRWVEGEPPRFRSQRTVALLGYLVVEKRPVAREALAALFWPDETASKGKANLRRELHNLGNILPGCWEADRKVVHFRPSAKTVVDVYQMVTLEKEEQWVEAAKLLQGEFLEGVYLSENLAFETWLLAERERWRQRAEHVLRQAVAAEVRAGDRVAALRFGRRLLQLLPWHEEMQRQVMLLLAQEGQTSAALKQFETCKQALWEELGVEVSPETLALYERIRDPAPFALHNIPAPTTPLVGRKKELALLQRWLADEDVRLITITGAGGMGKTRLALALAQALLQQPGQPFADGIYLVNLAALDDPDHLVSAIAAVLKFQLHRADNRSPQRRLLDYLQKKQMLLLFDNFEHLLPGAQLVTEILQRASAVQIVATARERLDLRWEQLLPLHGLAHEQVDLAAADPTENEAAQLFLSTARRLRQDFTITDKAERAQLYRICRLVEGMPLALELAATWTNTLSLAVIADEIEHGLGLLATETHDVPERHRSIRVVFDTSWGRLSPQEQRALAALSVFRGGFTREAAKSVAGADMRIVARLVNSSLLDYQQDQSRYTLHELLRQYAAEKMTIKRVADLRSRHLGYFTDIVGSLQRIGESGNQTSVMDQLEIEVGNLRAALDWSVQTPAHSLQGLRLATGLEYFWITRGYRSEGHERLSRLLGFPDTEKDRRLKARAMMVLGRLEYHSTGDRTAVIRLCKESLAIQETISDEMGRIRNLCSLGQVERHHHNLEEATRYYQQALALAEKTQDKWAICNALAGLGAVALERQDIAVARSFLQKGLPLAKEIGDLRRMGHFLAGLGIAAIEEEAWEEGGEFVRQAVRVYRRDGDQDGLAFATSILGELARSEGQHEAAIRYYEEGLALKYELGVTPRAIGTELFNLGQTYLLTGQVEQALSYLRECKRVGESVESQELLHCALEGFANAAAHKEPEQAARLWGAAEVQRESLQQGLHAADCLAHEYFVGIAKKQVEQDAFAAAWAAGREMTLDEAVAYAQATAAKPDLTSLA